MHFWSGYLCRYGVNIIQSPVVHSACVYNLYSPCPPQVSSLSQLKLLGFTLISSPSAGFVRGESSALWGPQRPSLPPDLMPKGSSQPSASANSPVPSLKEGKPKSGWQCITWPSNNQSHERPVVRQKEMPQRVQKERKTGKMLYLQEFTFALHRIHKETSSVWHRILLCCILFLPWKRIDAWLWGHRLLPTWNLSFLVETNRGTKWGGNCGRSKHLGALADPSQHLPSNCHSEGAKKWGREKRKEKNCV